MANKAVVDDLKCAISTAIEQGWRELQRDIAAEIKEPCDENAARLAAGFPVLARLLLGCGEVVWRVWRLCPDLYVVELRLAFEPDEEPVRVAVEAGDSLEDVFRNVWGTILELWRQVVARVGESTGSRTRKAN